MKKLSVLAIVVFGTLGLIAGFILLNSEPDEFTDAQKQEAISEILGRKANLNPDVKTGNTSFEGEYARFNYPAAAEIYEYRDPGIANNESKLESFSFDLESPRRIFNYTVTGLEPNIINLEDIPAVTFRKNGLNGYTSREEKLDGAAGATFTKNRSGEYLAEKTGYFLVNGKLYSISVTASTLEDAEKLYKQIIAGFRFK